MLCAARKSLHWQEQSQAETTQSMANTSAVLVPAQLSESLSFPEPRGARGCLCFTLQDIPALPQLPGQEHDGLFPILHNQTLWAAQKLQLGFDLKRNQPLSPGLAALGQIQTEVEEAEPHSCREFGEHRHKECLCRASRTLRPGPESAELVSSVKLCSAELSKAAVTASARQRGAHLMTAAVNRNTGQGQGTSTSLRLPVNLQRYSKGCSSASWSSNRYLVTKPGCQGRPSGASPAFPKE